MSKLFMRANDLVFLVAWGVIFFSENIHAITRIPAKALFVVAVVLVVVSGALHFSVGAKIIERLRGGNGESSSR